MTNNLLVENGRNIFNEKEVKDILNSYQIPTTEYTIIENEEEIKDIDLPFPVVLKVCSKNIIHKSEICGVKLNITDKDNLIKEFKNMSDRFPNEKFIVETMEEDGLEIIVGLVRDEIFGLNIMLGLGGIFTEIFEDVSFRIIPINDLDAESMINNLKAHRVLKEFRGQKVNRKLIKDLLIKVSCFARDNKKIINQLDLNPVIVREDSLVVVDGSLIIDKN